MFRAWDDTESNKGGSEVLVVGWGRCLCEWVCMTVGWWEHGPIRVWHSALPRERHGTNRSSRVTRRHPPPPQPLYGWTAECQKSQHYFRVGVNEWLHVLRTNVWLTAGCAASHWDDVGAKVKGLSWLYVTWQHVCLNGQVSVCLHPVSWRHSLIYSR